MTLAQTTGEVLPFRQITALISILSDARLSETSMTHNGAGDRLMKLRAKMSALVCMWTTCMCLQFPSVACWSC